MAKWLAGWNMPACLPESDPGEFNTWESARDYLVSELNNWLSSETIAPENGPPTESEMQLTRTIRDIEYGDYENDEYTSLPTAGYVFWIMESK